VSSRLCLDGLGDDVVALFAEHLRDTLIIRLSDSVAPLVKMISFGVA